MNMKYVLRYVLLAVTITAAFFPHRLDAAGKTSTRFQRMMEAMPCLPASERDSVFRCPQLANGKQFIVCHDANGQITHMGMSVFTDELKALSSPVLCNFIERLMLEILLRKNDRERLKFMNEERFKMMLNGYPFGHERFRQFSDCLPLFEENSASSFKEYDRGYSFNLENPDASFVIAFPKDRELIFGTDKAEQDSAIGELLAASTLDRLSIAIPSAQSLRDEGNNVWRLPGSAFLIDSLRSDLFFRMDGNEIKPIFQPDDPVHSVQNLLMGQVDVPRVVLEINHKQYGLKTPRYRLSVAQTLNALCDENTRSFAVGRLVNGGRDISGVLVIYNPKFQFINMLMMTIDRETLFDPTAVIPVYLYTNVPQQNILNLFE